jgi:hypothetical protein
VRKEVSVVISSVASELALGASENKAEGEGSDRTTEKYCVVYGIMVWCDVRVNSDRYLLIFWRKLLPEMS